jgi:tetrahedral aminopeptidase
VRDKSLAFLKDMMAAPSPSGYEQPVQDVVRAYAAGFADRVSTDVMGNVIAARNEGGSPRVMLAGHCDEIGLIVKRIDARGYLHFTQVGGWDPGVLLGQWVEVHTASGPIKGVVGLRSFRGPDAPSHGGSVKLEWLFVDIGATSREEAAETVRVGDIVTVGTPCHDLRNGRMGARAWDDKAGVWVVMEALRLLQRRKHSAAVFAVSTVQEEVGLRGAKAAAFGIDPHVGIAVDVGFAADTPADSKKKTADIEMGKGPIITRGANINPRVFDRLVRAAESKKIAYQPEAAPGGTGTDANVMQLTRSGVAAGLIGVPTRYMHTPVEVVQFDDLEDSAKLLAEFIVQLTPDADFTP